MKKLAVILLCMCLLTGCSTAAYETLGPVEHVSATVPDLRKVVMTLPVNAAVLTASGGSTMYICNDYSIAVQTLAAGDLNATIQSVTGFEMSQLTVMEKTCGDHTRYDFVWTAATEEGDTVCRAAVIDDGNYHYAMTVMAAVETAGEWKDEWNDLFRSYCLES